MVWRNLMLTFLLSGLWHGANITFVLWGGLHGLLLILERLRSWRLPRPFAVLGVFLLVSLLWLPFRAEDMGHLQHLISQMMHLGPFGESFSTAILSVFSLNKALWLLGVGILFIMAEAWMGKQAFDEAIAGFGRPVRWVIYYFLILSIFFLANFDVTPSFIYFQF